MTAVLDRRLIESQRRAFVYQGRAEIPLRSRRAAPLAAVAAFLAGRTDDDRIAALVAALAWAKPRKAMMISAYREDALPFAYAALKPLFDPDGIGPDNGERRLIDPLRLVRLIRAGRIADSVQLAQRLARGRGLSVPFAMRGSASPLDPERLLAAILFPLAPIAHLRLRDRAYPDMTKIEEASDVS